MIVLKDNCCTGEDWTFVVDKSDSSVSRYVVIAVAALVIIGSLLYPALLCDYVTTYTI